MCLHIEISQKSSRKLCIENRDRKRTELSFSKLSRTEPNSNWKTPVRFEPVTVLSFEKSSYILKKRALISSGQVIS